MKHIRCLFLLLPAILLGQQADKKAVDQLLTEWHQAASDADFQAYFNRMTEGAVFIGTDASENWDRAEFMAFSKPYFDRGKAWSFKAVQRNIYLGPGGAIAWFDELLDTWMELCRGSGVARKVDGQWKIEHYVLSMTMPNEAVEGAVGLKRAKDSTLKKSLRALNPNE